MMRDPPMKTSVLLTERRAKGGQPVDTGQIEQVTEKNFFLRQQITSLQAPTGKNNSFACAEHVS